MIYVLFLAISFGASCIGTICGIGGGVLIKPLLDSFHVMSVASISFLSGCTVMTMSIISVIRGRNNKAVVLNTKTSTPLAIGAAIGGILGTQLFQILSKYVGDDNKVGFVQALCLFIVTFFTFIYTIYARKIKTLQVENIFLCLIIGLGLGILSSFLGIGGGPINLVVLYYFFSMNTKTAAKNSIYIIMFSQTAGFLRTVLTNSVPEFGLLSLVLMVLGGLFGGIFGSRINKEIKERNVKYLFLALMIVIMAINLYNVLVFSGIL